MAVRFFRLNRHTGNREDAIFMGSSDFFVVVGAFLLVMRVVERSMRWPGGTILSPVFYAGRSLAVIVGGSCGACEYMLPGKSVRVRVGKSLAKRRGYTTKRVHALASGEIFVHA